MNLLPLPSLSIIGMVGSALAAALASWWITDAIDSAALTRFKLAAGRAREAALETQNALTFDTSAIGVRVSTEFEAERERTYYVSQTIIKEVPFHVSARTDARYPLPWGLVRVHDAAILGLDPSAFSIPAGQSDDAASSVKASDLAANDAENFGACRANQEQLGRLLEWARGVETAWNDYSRRAKGRTP